MVKQCNDGILQLQTIAKSASGSSSGSGSPVVLDAEDSEEGAGRLVNKMSRRE
jgi:hypothetical protein